MGDRERTRWHTVILYTLQTPGVDITRPPVKIPESYWREGEPYYDMARYLQWDHWIWCLRHIDDLENEWLSFEKLLPITLWTLDVPETLVRWCSLDRQCQNTVPIDKWFYNSEGAIRDLGEIPMGLVVSPISRRYVTGQTMRDASCLRAEPVNRRRVAGTSETK